jgi:hypothetical protein
MKHRESRDIGLLRLNLGVWIGWRLSATPRPLNPQDRATVPTNRRFVGNKAGLDGYWRNENIFHTMGIETLTVQHVERRYIIGTL